MEGKKMKKIEECFIEITTNISNYTNATTIDMKIYWLKAIHKTSVTLETLIEEELSLED